MRLRVVRNEQNYKNANLSKVLNDLKNPSWAFIKEFLAILVFFRYELEILLSTETPALTKEKPDIIKI